MLGKIGVQKRISSHVKLPNLPLHHEQSLQKAQNSSSQKYLNVKLHYRGKSDNVIHNKKNSKPIDENSLSKGQQISSFFIRQTTANNKLTIIKSQAIRNLSKRNLRITSSKQVQQLRKNTIGVKINPLKHFIRYQTRQKSYQDKQMIASITKPVDVIQKIRIKKHIKQSQEQFGFAKQNSKSNVKQIKRKDFGVRKKSDQSSQEKSLQKNYTTKSSSAINSSSKGLSNPFLINLKMITQDSVHKFLVSGKLQKNNTGNVSAFYWCLIDSIIQSLIKCVNSRAKCFQLSKAYTKLGHQIFFLQQGTIMKFQDIGQRKVVIQYFLYEKTVIYVLGVMKSIEIQNKTMLKTIVSIMQILKQNRRVILQMVIQALELDKKCHSFRKPKYMAKQKKIIQVSKLNSVIKQLLFKNGIIDQINKRNLFLVQQQLLQHHQLVKIDNYWKLKIFDIPISPFLSNLLIERMILVIDPQNFLFKFDQQNELFYLRPFTQKFLKSLQNYFHLIFFTQMNRQDTEDFIRNLGSIKFDGFLYRNHITFQQCRKTKDIKRAIKLPSGQHWKYFKDEIIIIDHQRDFYTEEFKKNIWNVCYQNISQDYLMHLSKQLIQHAQKRGNINRQISI